MNETKQIVGFTFAHAAIVAILVLLFLWPAGGSAPKDLPIGLVGPDQQTKQVALMLETQQPGVLEVTNFDSKQQAEEAIAKREIYGALVLGREPEVLVASGANASVAMLLQDLGEALVRSSAAGQPSASPGLTVTDLAPLPAADERGVLFGSSSLPLVIGGISLGALASLRLQKTSSRILLVSVASALTGMTAAGVMAWVFGALPGNYWVSSLAMASILAAIGFALIGGHAVLGLVGFGLTAATLFLLGNPLNGVSLPVEFYPDGWGALGQMMPVGAGFELLKRINFFEAADQSAQWWVLAAWITVGLGLSLLRIKKQSS